MKTTRLVMILLMAACLLAAMVGCASEAQEETQPETTEYVDYDSCCYFYNYGTESYVESDLATFQAVTGGRCQLSTYSWEFLSGDYSHMVQGYDERYGIFLYEYDSGMLGRYQAYLEASGYECRATEQYVEGICYYFRNEETRYIVQIFIVEDNAYLVIEPYIAAEG